MTDEVETFLVIKPFIDKRFHDICLSQFMTNSSDLELRAVLVKFVLCFDLVSDEYIKCIDYIDYLFLNKKGFYG